MLVRGKSIMPDTNLLLIGAGLSRNWHAPLAREVADVLLQEIGADPQRSGPAPCRASAAVAQGQYFGSHDRPEAAGPAAGRRFLRPAQTRSAGRAYRLGTVELTIGFLVLAGLVSVRLGFAGAVLAFLTPFKA
jgi:hypothetical protein